MAEAQTSSSEASKGAETKTKAPKPKLTGADLVKKRAARRKLKAAGRKKRAQKLQADKEFAKTFFGARSKRSTDKKQLFRKKKTRKK